MPANDYFEEEEFTSKVNTRTVLRVLALTSKYKTWVAGFLLSIAMVSVLDSVFTYLSKLIIDTGIVPGDKTRLTELLALYFGLGIVQSAGAFGFIYLAGVLGERIRYDLSQKLFEHLQKLSLSYFSQTAVGWIIARVTSDAKRVSELVTWGMLDVVWAIINIITAMTFMIFINPTLALIVFLMLPVIFFVSVEFRKRILLEFRNVRKWNSRITGAYNENITGVRVVKALGREDTNLGEFSQLTGELYRSGYRAAWYSALFLPSVQLIVAVALGFIVYYTGTSGKVMGMTVGSIQAFVSYVTFMMWPIQDLARVFAELQRAIASAERMFSMLDQQPEIVDKPDARDAVSIRGDIEFDHVGFWYEDGEVVLDDLSLHIKSGEKIALVGPTGGGKSTIVNLMCRFYEPKRGIIRINGIDYTDYTQNAIQSRIGVVLQTPHLFSGSIKQNIAYGDLKASDEQIVNAAKMVGAHDFIMKFEKGYDEEVGEGGNLLSVGQKQVISLARAILADPEIFIMDEATSSVDTLTEALIQKGMALLMQGRTSFIIAHRLSTIKNADRIIVIEGGKIAEMGSHQELLRLRGKYYNLYTRQFLSRIDLMDSENPGA